MAIARAHQVALDTTRYYHCISRCVRRAYLCGNDPLTGKNMDHRKEWILHRLQELAESFAIQVCAYAILDNHYHLVLYVDLEKAQGWAEEEVLLRWKALSQKKENEQEENFSEKDRQQVDVWRERLCNLSWFMRYLNEKIAREANREDQCQGRFWQGRFKSQALIDEGALLACMAYVDLNPVRAKMSQTPEESDFTSIQKRIQEYKVETSTKVKKVERKKSLTLMPLQEENKPSSKLSIPIHPKDYFSLVDWTGRSYRAEKKGKIPEMLQSILTRLGLQEEGWIKMTKQFTKTFARAAGNITKLKSLGADWGQRWLKGSRSTQSFYLSPS